MCLIVLQQKAVAMRCKKKWNKILKICHLRACNYIRKIKGIEKKKKFVLVVMHLIFSKYMDQNIMCLCLKMQFLEGYNFTLRWWLVNLQLPVVLGLLLVLFSAEFYFCST